MSWIKIDDQFADHPKVVEAGPLAAWLYVCGLTYCGRYLTDGWIPDGQVRKLADVDKATDLADRLVDVGLWDRVDDGYVVHDYLDYNPSGAKVKAEREANARRQAEWRERNRDDNGQFGDGNDDPTNDSNGVSNSAVTTAPSPSPSPSPSPDPDCSCGSDAHAREDSETADALSSFIATAAHDFENCIGLIAGEHQSEEITAYATDLHNRGHPEWWQMALDVACDNNARKWSYVRAVLQNWLEQGRPGLKPPANGSRASPEEYDEAAALEKAARYGLGVSDGV